MFGAPMFAESPFGGTPADAPAVPTGGGGWSHRGPVKLPQRKSPEWKPPVFKKPNPYRW
jgi:hypothetical protein